MPCPDAAEKSAENNLLLSVGGGRFQTCYSDRRNVIPQGQGSGVGEGDFEAFFSFAAPIEVKSVSAIIVNGVRIPCYRK